MAYIDPNTILTPDPGDVLTAAWCDTVRDDLEFLVDPPACSVYHNTTQSQTTGTALTALAANSENYDNDSMHSTVTNNSRITIQTAGRYEVGAVVSWAANATGNRALAFAKNGVGVNDYLVDIRTGTATNSTGISGSRTLVLAAGDYVEVSVWQTSGGNLNATLTEFYCIFRTR